MQVVQIKEALKEALINAGDISNEQTYHPTQEELQMIYQEENNHGQSDSESNDSEEIQLKRIQMIQSQIKTINPTLVTKRLDKGQFTKSISNMVQQFFNPHIDDIYKRQKDLCQKMGLKVIKTQEQDRKEKIALNRESSTLIQQPKQIINESNQKIHKQQTDIKIQQPNPDDDGHFFSTSDLKTQNNQSIKIENENLSSSNQNSRKKSPEKNEPKVVIIKRNNQEQKKLLKQMQEKYNVKFRNNRLYMKGMPRKPVSSFFFFFKDYSKKLHADNEQLEVSKQLTYGSALAKRISKRWKQMTTQQKLPYKKLSQKTRQQYRKSMEDFKSQHNQVFQSFKKIKRIKANQTRRIKIQRDQAVSQHLKIAQENSQSQEQNDQQPIVQQTKDQVKFEQIDVEEQQLPIVVPNDNSESQNSNIKQQKDQSSKQTPVKRKRNRIRSSRQRFKSLHKPKSPSPSFFFFYNEKKQFISKQYGVNTGAQITKVASKLWKEMPNQEKYPYEVKADQRRKKYYQDMKRFEFDYPQQWAKMQAYKRRVPANNSKVQPIKEQQQKDKQQNSQSNTSSQKQLNSQSEKQDVQIDSLEGTIIKKQPKPKNQKQSNKEINKISIVKIQQPKVVKQQEPKIVKKQELKVVKRQGPKIIIKQESKILVQNNSLKTLPKVQEKKKTRQRRKSKKGQQQPRPVRPKAPVSSFFMFYKENNQAFSQQFKQAQGGKLVQYASTIWKNMSQQEKKPYQIQAQQSRQKYYQQMQQYKQKYPQQLKKRRQELKKKHKDEEQGLIKPPKKRRKRSNPQPAIIPPQTQQRLKEKLNLSQDRSDTQVRQIEVEKSSVQLSNLSASESNV